MRLTETLNEAVEQFQAVKKVCRALHLAAQGKAGIYIKVESAKQRALQDYALRLSRDEAESWLIASTEPMVARYRAVLTTLEGETRRVLCQYANHKWLIVPDP